MLQSGLQLIVQYPEATGVYRCRGFKDLRVGQSNYVVFDGATALDQSTANLLGEVFCREVLAYAGVTELGTRLCRAEEARFDRMSRTRRTILCQDSCPSKCQCRDAPNRMAHTEC
jgi:hypothetical protein